MSNFEERLLSALTEEIATRKAENGMTTTTTPVRRGSRRRLVGLSAALAGVAAAATAVVTLTGLTSSPAYAVTKASDGAVSVQIHEFSDPEGLEAELAQAGVRAVVDYLPQGQTCKDPRGSAGTASGRFGASIRRSGDGIAFTIEEGQVPAGETLVLTVSKSEDGADKPPFATSLQVVKGAVAACVPTSMPVPGDGGAGANFEDDGGAGFHTKTEGTDQGPGLSTGTE